MRICLQITYYHLINMGFSLMSLARDAVVNCNGNSIDVLYLELISKRLLTLYLIMCMISEENF